MPPPARAMVARPLVLMAVCSLSSTTASDRLINAVLSGSTSTIFFIKFVNECLHKTASGWLLGRLNPKVSQLRDRLGWL